MNAISSAQFESFEHCIDACRDCPVIIERNGQPKAVLVSLEAYEYFMELETGVMQLLAEMETESKPAAKKAGGNKKVAAKKPAKKAAKKAKPAAKKKAVKKVVKKAVKKVVKKVAKKKKR